MFVYFFDTSANLEQARRARSLQVHGETENNLLLSLDHYSINDT